MFSQNEERLISIITLHEYIINNKNKLSTGEKYFSLGLGYYIVINRDSGIKLRNVIKRYGSSKKTEMNILSNSLTHEHVIIDPPEYFLITSKTDMHDTEKVSIDFKDSHSIESIIPYTMFSDYIDFLEHTKLGIV